MAEYIDRDKILFELFEAYDSIDPRFLRGRAIREAIALIKKEINTMPTADVIPKGAYDQVLWERDIAVRQLREDYGVDLGEKKHADVAPVKHGKWVWNPNGMDWGLGAWECSECACRNNNLGMNSKMNPLMFSGSKYCPNCGAKMDGE